VFIVEREREIEKMKPDMNKPVDPEQIKTLLEKGHEILMENIEDEVEFLTTNTFASTPYMEKYERAKSIFEKVLSLDPDNAEAKIGILNCEEMLNTYIPVQHLAVLEPLDASLLPNITVQPGDRAAGKSDFQPEREKEKVMPWDIIRNRRAKDHVAMKFTTETFMKSREDAMRKVGKIIDEAKALVDEKKSDKHEIFKKYRENLEDLQENLHRSWKGHGPDIINDAINMLKSALNIK